MILFRGPNPAGGNYGREDGWEETSIDGVWGFDAGGSEYLSSEGMG